MSEDMEFDPRRERVPDPDLVVEHLLDDLRNEDVDQGYLDAVGTLGDPDMTEDDLIEVAIRLGRRLIDTAEGDAP